MEITSFSSAGWWLQCFNALPVFAAVVSLPGSGERTVKRVLRKPVPHTVPLFAVVLNQQ